MFRRVATFIYGVLCYLTFFGTFLYAIGFIGNFIVPLEERDLVNAYGDEYKRYQRSVPMIVPVRIGKGIAGVPVTSRKAKSV